MRERRWRKLTSRIRQHWNALRERNVEEASGNWDDLAGRMQERKADEPARKPRPVIQ